MTWDYSECVEERLHPCGRIEQWCPVMGNWVDDLTSCPLFGENNDWDESPDVSPKFPSSGGG